MTMTKQGRRHGLTLMELLVVLVILIGLAGVVVPMLPSVLTRTHTATAATNMGEIARCLGEYQSLYGSPCPDGWDSLMAGNTIAPYVLNSQAPNAPATAAFVSTYLGTYTLQAGDTNALNAAGITTAPTATTPLGKGIFAFAAPVNGVLAAPNDPTFYPYAGYTPGTAPTGMTLADTTTVLATPTPLAISNLGLPANGQYVIFGLGTYNSMVGRNMVAPPVHFSDDPNQAPVYYYARFGVIFKIGNWTGTTQGLGNYQVSSQATLAAVVDISTDSGLAGINAHILEYYQAVQASN